MPYDLTPVRAAFEALGGLLIPMMHVAGSKGKGTTSTLLAQIIELNGDRVGLFTSPFIENETEMVQVNGTPITPQDFARLQGRVLTVGPTLSPFEVQTLAAFEYFKEQNCDVLVVECGLGGLTDATNVATEKALTILTHVELEHQEFLGETLEEITRQKLGICRPGVPLLTPGTQTHEVFACIESEVPEVQLVPGFALGVHHPESVGLAVAAAEFLGYTFDSVIEEALARLVLPGRFEVLRMGAHTLILDGAHTYDSVQFFLERLQEFVQENGLPEPQFGIHFLKDKREDLWTLFPLHRSTWISLSDERAGPCPPRLVEQKLSDFLETHLGKAGDAFPPRLLILTGSFKLLALFRKSVTI